MVSQDLESGDVFDLEARTVLPRKSATDENTAPKSNALTIIPVVYYAGHCRLP